MADADIKKECITTSDNALLYFTLFFLQSAERKPALHFLNSLALLLCDLRFKPEGRAFALFRLNAVCKAVGFEYLLTNGKSKSCAYHVTLYLCVTVVSVKYLRQKLLGNALSVVCYFNTNRISLVYLLDTNDLIVTCVVYSVVYKVVNYLIQLCNITLSSSGIYLIS